MKTLFYWAVVFLMLVGGIAAQWLPFDSLYQSLGVWALIFVIAIVPAWLAVSSRLVKLAIDNAQQSNFKAVQSLLISRGWLIFPSPKYNNIVVLLRELSRHPDQKPTLHSSEFSQYIVNDGMGYILTWEGKEKMLEKMGSGWINWKIYESPKPLVILLRIVVILALIRGIIFLISLFTRH